jgi:AraC-like DNA-binding protein
MLSAQPFVTCCRHQLGLRRLLQIASRYSGSNQYGGVVVVAEEIGCETAGQFSRLFKREAGMSPTAYRREFER